MNSYQKEYINRINKVIDYIYQHPAEDLSLNKLANIALFSPFHFHRIFSAFVGETVNEFVKRIKIEKAARHLIQDYDKPINKIALECGFINQSAFCRSFKKHFKHSAQEYRTIHNQDNSKNDTINSKDGKLIDIESGYVCNTNFIKPEIMKTNIEIKEMPELKLACCKHVGHFDQIGQTYGKLMQWAGPKGLLASQNLKTATIYHDDPKVTDPSKVRQSACITIEQNIKMEGEISPLSLPKKLCAVGRFEISAHEFKDAWDTMCIGVSESGYQPADGNPYELYHNNHEEHPEKKFILDICIPVKRL